MNLSPSITRCSTVHGILLSVDGDLSASWVQTFQDECLDAIAHTPHLVLDLGRVVSMHSLALDALMLSVSFARARHCDMSIVAPPGEPVSDTLIAAHLDQIIRIYESRDAAVHAYTQIRRHVQSPPTASDPPP